MSDNEESFYWGNDPYWMEALDRFLRDRQAGERTITLDLDAVEEAIYNSDSPAFRLMDALASVKEHEGWGGLSRNTTPDLRAPATSQRTKPVVYHIGLGDVRGSRRNRLGF